MGRTGMSLVSFLISRLRIRGFPGDSERNAVSSLRGFNMGMGGKTASFRGFKYTGHSRLLSHRAGCQTLSPQ